MGSTARPVRKNNPSFLALMQGIIVLSFKFPFFRFTLLLLISFQVVFYGLMWFRALHDPNLKTADFIIFYGAGRMARAGQYHLLYDLQAQGMEQERVVQSPDYAPLIFNHPPYIVPLLGVVSVDDYVMAFTLWTLVRLAVLAACALLLYRFLLRAGWDPASARLALTGCVLFFPIFISILGGQDTVFSLLALLTFMFALLRMKEGLAGLSLAFATLAPTVAGALALPLLASRRRAGLWFLAGAAGLAIYTFFLVGIQGIREFIALLATSSRAESYGFNWQGMYNLAGLLTRSLPGLEPDLVRWIAWAAAFLSILLVCVWWWNRGGGLTVRHVGLGVLLAAFASPHLYFHLLSVLLLPLVALMTLLWEANRRSTAVLLIPAVSTGLMLLFILAPGLSYLYVYALMAALAYGLGSTFASEACLQKPASPSTEG